jgi:tetratricopeptide (TPR) repeat protein
MLKRFPEALEADRKAVAADPHFGDAYVGMALTLRSMKRIPEAREAAQKAYEINPSDPRSAALLRQLQ